MVCFGSERGDFGEGLFCVMTGLGSCRALVSSNGVVAKYDYDVYGSVRG